MKQQFTAIITKEEITEEEITKEDEYYVALCPELDIASQGTTIEEARYNLAEAVELFFEHASDSEISRRTRKDYFITPFEVDLGETTNAFG